MIRVVIAEDDPMVAQINQQYLRQFENANFQVERVFGNGRDALEYLRTEKADLALLDVYMPGLSGLELLHQMRTEHIYTAVIMVTAATEVQTVEEILQLGIVDYLIKPYSLRRFREAIQKYLSMQEVLTEGRTLSQTDVDRLFRTPLEQEVSHQAALRKGLNQLTLDHIMDYLKTHRESAHSCESLSQVLGLSKVTVRRYLNYLIETGEVVSSIDYETGGRPGILYSLNKGGEFHISLK